MFPQPKKYGRYIVLAILALFVFKNPEGAAHLAREGGALLSQAAGAASRFASSL